MWPRWWSAPSRGGEEQEMSYDLVIKNGWVVDGSGLPRYRGDVGVVAGRIAAIGRIRESARDVMGERAFEKPATEDDLTAMERELRQAIAAGAMGFTTSRSPSHETPDRRPVASRVAPWDEVQRLVGAMGEMNAGIFEIAGEGVDRTDNDPGLRDYQRRLRDLATETGRPVTFGLFTRRDAPHVWRTYLDLLEDTAAAGGRMFAQVHSRALSSVLSFKTQLPFDRLPA